MAILLLLPRIFTYHQLWFRVCVWTAAALVTIVHLSSVPIYIVFCTPRVGNSWEDVLVTSQCAPTIEHQLIQGVLGLVLNVFILIIPLPIIFGLNLPKRRKAGIIVTFSYGILYIIPRHRIASSKQHVQLT